MMGEEKENQSTDRAGTGENLFQRPAAVLAGIFASIV
jgi:hypothetical protein